ncbi:hypothetical protein PGTUg99_017946 [Puccinia graminis f. sp. tritici]|uniref:Uncharacterized protein n=1 Tax=Puccinia graminis f. sp. tritici TaxID=56615 RepID=A0A5B0S4R6_PUCGR|nr:hypothetical protein PGTUg99_017946 [Puccinia graminis f. sp. tritici]
MIDLSASTPPTNKITLDETTNGQAPATQLIKEPDSSRHLLKQFQEWDVECHYTLWDAVIHEAYQHPAAYQIPTGIPEFLEFCKSFLDSEYVFTLEETLGQLLQSELGIEFTLRNHNAVILESILEDLQEHNGSAGQHDPPQPASKAAGKCFHEAQVVVIKMGRFTTPDKNYHHHKLTITQRSHELIKDIATSDMMYDTRLTHHPKITQLFHGTRKSSMASFYQHGIQPIACRNKFSKAPTFYTTNDPQQAFELPLHNHPGLPPDSPIAIFQFNIPTAVLHGDLPPSEGEHPFDVKQYLPSNDLASWRTFCDQNMSRDHCGFNHAYDIVIGPLCIPSSAPLQPFQIKTTPVPTTQIAFCTKRAGRWLEQYVQRVFVEDGGEE